MLYDIKVPRRGRTVDLIVATERPYELQELKNRLYDIIKDEDLKDDLSFANKITVENPQMKFFFIKNGFNIIELKENTNE
jgi:hypothetical protein